MQTGQCRRCVSWIRVWGRFFLPCVSPFLLIAVASVGYSGVDRSLRGVPAKTCAEAFLCIKKGHDTGFVPWPLKNAIRERMTWGLFALVGLSPGTKLQHRQTDRSGNCPSKLQEPLEAVLRRLFCACQNLPRSPCQGSVLHNLVLGVRIR